MTIQKATVAKIALTFVIAGLSGVAKRVGEQKIDEHYAPELTE